jgi:Bacterial archaeo-eukaryotic release factor family 3
MSLLSRDEIQSLSQTSGWPCVSIFMPTFRSGDTQQNPIRFKNLLRSAEERLADWGLRNGDSDSFLDPARRLVDDRSFWEHQEEGLALFRSPDVFKTYRLPLALRELSVVEDRFHLKPLFPLLSGEGHFYILALSLKSIRLILASRYDAREVDLGGIPQSFQEAMGHLTRRYSQFQAGTSSKTVSRMPIFHGHGTGEDDLKAEIVKYFQIVDDGLTHLEVDVDRDAPFVLAGVEHLLPRYREASKLPNVLDEGLTGNSDGLSAEELRDKAWEIVEPVLLAERRKAADRFGDLRGTGLASTELEEILPAACDGRVDTLFTARGVRVWGSYDPHGRTLRFQKDQERQANGSEDLLDRAAVETFLRGGRVYVVEQQEVPEGYAVAAVFRY